MDVRSPLGRESRPVNGSVIGLRRREGVGGVNTRFDGVKKNKQTLRLKRRCDSSGTAAARLQYA